MGTDINHEAHETSDLMITEMFSPMKRQRLASGDLCGLMRRL